MTSIICAILISGSLLHEAGSPNQPDEARVPSPTDSAATVRITAATLTPCRWIDLVEAVAQFHSRWHIEVEGSLGPGAVLLVTSSPGVRDFKLSKSTIESGAQDIDVVVAARMVPDAINRLSFAVAPQSRNNATIKVNSPLLVAVRGPSPYRLMLADPRVLDITLPSRASAAAVALCPILSQPNVGSQQLGAVVRQQNSQFQLSRESLPLGKRTALSISSPRPLNPSFFVDDLIETPLKLLPSVSTPAVEGSTYRLAFRAEAPFKKYLAYAAAVLLVATLIATATVFCRRLLA